ncbi:MAG: hypothetical protein KC656_04940, partial [Myxococcales bacterium]|nr:hypothetical protein [Myxococcales bacterium]
LRAVLRDSPNHRMAGDAAGQRAVDHLLALPAALDVLAPLASDIESALAGAEGTRRLDLLHRHIDLLARRGPIGDLTAQAERWTRSLPSELFADGLVERARARLAETIKVDVDLLAGAVAHVVSPGRRAVALAMLARARSWTNDPRTPEATEAALAALSPDLPTIDRIQASGHLAASLQAVDPARALAVLDAAWELAWPRYPYEALSLLLVRTFVEPMDALAREQARHLLGRVRPHLCAPAWAEAEVGMAVALVDAGEVEAGWELVLDVLPVFEADPSLPVAAFLSNLALRLVFEPERLEVLLPHLRGYNSRGFERFIEGFITGEDGELPEDWAQIRSALVNGDPLPAVADRRLSRVGMGLRVALRNRR